MNYIGALALDGKKFDYKTNERLQKALELKLFEDQKDTIKLTSLVSNVVDKATQEKIDVVKSRLIRNYGYNEVERDRRAELRGQHLRPRPHEEVEASWQCQLQGWKCKVAQASKFNVRHRCHDLRTSDLVIRGDTPWARRSNAITSASASSSAAR